MSGNERTVEGPWLFGPAADLLLGCGVLYALLILPVSFAGSAFVDGKPPFLLPLGVALFSASHYGATLLRVYERREDRRSYALFAVYATLLLVAAFVAGLRSPAWSSYLLTLYLTWSPWHYTGQNYGLAVMFVRRAGVPLTPVVKRLLYSSFLLSYLVTLVVMHAGQGVAWDPAGTAGHAVTFLSLGIPRPVAELLVPLLILADGVALLASGVALVRAGSLRRVSPAFALMLTQALWFTLPFGIEFLGLHSGIAALDQQQAVRDYLLLVAFAHGIQYLWVTTYYARRASRWSGTPLFLAKALCCGLALWTLPVVLFAPERTGGMGYDSGLALLLASVINLHHFILDGAIWKLRHSRVASVLIRSAPQPEAVVRPGALPLPRASFPRRAVWGLCAAGVACWAFIFASYYFAYPTATAHGDLAAQGRILRRIEWLGHDYARLRMDLGRRLARAGESELAARSFERAVSFDPSWPSFQALAKLYEQRGDAGAADRVYADAEASLGPTREILLTRSALAFQSGDPAAALAHARRALANDPKDVEVLIIASEIAERIGDSGQALEHARAAHALRPDALIVASQLAWILATTPDAGLRNPSEALRVLEPMVPGPDAASPDTLDALAACYAADGRFADAVRTARRAIAAAGRRAGVASVDELRARLALYESGRPYVDVRPAVSASRSAPTAAQASAASAP